MYVVRVMEPVGDDILRGVVRRVADGMERTFHGSHQLLEVLGEHPPAQATPTGEGDHR